MQVANQILQQLGGNKFTVMTGAKLFVGSDNSLLFGFGKGAKNGANKCKITLVDDLYSVEFFNIRGVNVKTVALVEMVYGDRLAETFAEQTGFTVKL